MNPAGAVVGFSPLAYPRNGTQSDCLMNKPMSLALLVIGAILLFYGLKAGDSIGSGVSRAVTGTPTDRTIWFMAGGIICGLVGFFGLFRGSGGSK